MSPELQDFYNSVQNWIDRGCIRDNPYHDEYGLYAAILVYARKHELDAEELLIELKEQFIEVGLHTLLPFNTSIAHFITEVGPNHCFTNQKRLNWVADHATGGPRSNAPRN